MPKIKVANAELFFDVYGSKLEIGKSTVREKPTLLVLHGGHGFVDHTLYVQFWSQFSDIAQVIFLDQRGCGRSDLRTAEEWNLRYWGEDVYQFCQALGIEKPIIAGVSMGGHVMCEYVTKYPNHPGALIFCNTEAKFDLDLVCEAFRKLGGDEIAELARKNFSSPTPEIIEEFKNKGVPFYARNAYTPTEIARCQQRTQVFEHYCKNKMTQFNYLGQLNKIQCPTLFMVGEISPGHPPRAAQLMMAEIDPKLVTHHEFKNAGAPVYKDSPEEAEQVVRDLILKACG
jgi:pimeloyl-ACP methyl ester carboxylesterase